MSSGQTRFSSPPDYGAMPSRKRVSTGQAKRDRRRARGNELERHRVLLPGQYDALASSVRHCCSLTSRAFAVLAQHRSTSRHDARTCDTDSGGTFCCDVTCRCVRALLQMAPAHCSAGHNTAVAFAAETSRFMRDTFSGVIGVLTCPPCTDHVYGPCFPRFTCSRQTSTRARPISVAALPYIVRSAILSTDAKPLPAVSATAPPSFPHSFWMYRSAFAIADALGLAMAVRLIRDWLIHNGENQGSSKPRFRKRASPASASYVGSLSPVSPSPVPPLVSGRTSSMLWIACFSRASSARVAESSSSSTAIFIGQT